ncbi:hypothetical protein ASE48_08325 [Mycobacterium sp. Root265]|uniref:DUF2746 domain-containing protein n=1 Tax=Mycobacterium sp. Root265 TaxID=1736504 RepID=UPI000709C2E6|nr:DUF2746 domain-containing protein [Mycobacterium sp. Root265]KRD08564.1 hypothetical protein ASE48_08325 [Mycobacterium sp. Root265]
MSLFNPDNNWEVALLAFIALCGLLTVVLPVWFKVKKIDSQVSNSHDENLRDEITRGFREIQSELRIIHENMNLERRERIEGDSVRVTGSITVTPE